MGSDYQQYAPPYSDKDAIAHYFRIMRKVCQLVHYHWYLVVLTGYIVQQVVWCSDRVLDGVRYVWDAFLELLR